MLSLGVAETEISLGYIAEIKFEKIYFRNFLAKTLGDVILLI